MIQMIQRSYESLIRYARPSDSTISFEISNFRTYEQADFDSVRWFDLVTPPGGDSIQVESRTYQHSSNLRQGRTEYVPRWQQAPDYKKTSEGEQVAGLTVSQAFQIATANEPRLADVSKLTAYDVTVTLDGRARSYHAAFLWIEENNGLSMIPFDYVTGRVAEGLAERFPPGHELPSPWIPEPEKTGTPKEACFAGEIDLRSFGMSQAGFTDHTSGHHAASGSFSASCTCETDCSQRCVTNASSPSCEEWGDTGTCHRLSNPSITSVDGHANSSGTATCRAAVGCSWRSCWGCLCFSPTLTLGYEGSGLSINYTPQDAASITKESPFQCPACLSQASCDNDGLCESARGENQQNCPNDCGSSEPPPSQCNYNGLCESGQGEDAFGCPADCRSQYCEEGDWVSVEECYYLCDGWADGQHCYVN